jgi:hypothetical protein
VPAGYERAVAATADTTDGFRAASILMRSLAADLTLDDPDYVWLSQAAAYLEYRAREPAGPPAGAAGQGRVLHLVL